MNDASHPLKPFQRLITVSLETMKIVRNLPEIRYSLDKTININERKSYLEAVCGQEGLEISSVEKLISQHRFTGGQVPLGNDVIGAMKEKPKILERRERITSATQKIMDVIEIFEDV